VETPGPGASVELARVEALAELVLEAQARNAGCTPTKPAKSQPM
jgi:hypothetical protein